MRRGRAIHYRFQGVAAGVSLAGSALFFYGGLFPTPDKHHHLPGYEHGVIGGVLGVFFFALALVLLFMAPDDEDRP